MRNQAFFILALLLLVGGSLLPGPVTAQQPATNKLALLIAAPHLRNDGTPEKEMANDMAALEQALIQRGYAPGEILKLAGSPGRAQVLDFLSQAARSVATWKDGTIFLAYSGHGDYEGTDKNSAKPRLALANGDKVRWDEVFHTLRVPVGVHIILLPDGWHNNLLAGRVPPHVSVVVQKSLPGNELNCLALNHTFLVNGVARGHGIMSYYAARTLPQATTVEDWVQRMTALANADVAAGALPQGKRLSILATGAPQRILPGMVKQ